MHEVLAAEQGAMEAIAASRRHAEALIQTARSRARSIAERARARVAALERANFNASEPSANAAGGRLDMTEPTAHDLARLEAALQRLADQLLDGDDGGPQL